MSTLIVSDLHLGAAGGADLLRRPVAQEALLSALVGVERLVLLGDVFELRHGPEAEALHAGDELLRRVGEAMGEGEIVLLAGNHDHPMLAPWLEGRARVPAPDPLGLDSRTSAADVSPTLERLAALVSPARLTAAYPGLWVRPDVYATHGHYLDVHLTVPTGERLSAGMMSRLLARREPAGPRRAEDYERRLAPLYAWIDAMAQRAPVGRVLSGQGTVGMWRLLSGRRGRGWRRLPSLAAATTFPLVVGALNRVGLGPLRADLSVSALRTAGLVAMGEVATRLDVRADHLVFGHTHRAGPLPGDDVGEWRTPSGTALMNCGCWTFDGYFIGRDGAESPFWPGSAVRVGADGPPVLERLLARVGADQLSP
jgi:predicted phosphodiesterase